MNAIEPIADAVTGATLARAAEPATGVDQSGHTAERACLNCGTTLTGDYCHRCGQKGHVHRSLGAFGHDLLHGVFHFEGKVWRTLPMLAWHPGELTRRYIEGQRACFVSPVALFLFSVFLMFAVLGATGILSDSTGANIRAGINNTVVEQRALVARLEQQRASAQAQRQPTADLDRKLRSARDDLQVTEAFQDRGELKEGAITGEAATIAPWLRGLVEKVSTNPELLFFKLKTNAYKFSWMLIPMSVPFMWLLFPFSRKYRFYDHTVFVTYLLCFMTLLAVVASLLDAGGLPNLASLCALVPPVHMYRQLKGAYRLRRWSALWRTLLLLLFTAITTTIFLTILVGLGVLD